MGGDGIIYWKRKEKGAEDSKRETRAWTAWREEEKPQERDKKEESETQEERSFRSQGGNVSRRIK